MSGFRTLATGLAAAAMVAVGLVAPGTAWAETPTTIPTITAPTDGAVVSGVVDISVSTTAPRVLLQVNATDLGTFAAAGTVTVPWTTYGLADGSWSITAADCSAADECAVVGSTVTVTVANLHPTITSQLPNPFSPNGNAVKDTTTTTYVLAGTATVTWTALNVGGTIVGGPVSLGTQGAGPHTYVWDGKDAAKVVVPNGTYTVWITATDGKSTGRAATSVVVDTVAPTMTGVVGSGTVFYPVVDGYRDTFKPTIVLNERATLTLVVRNSAGSVVRKLSAVLNAGRVGITWNGRTAAGAIVPAGLYRWTYTATDAAANSRASAPFTVTVSLKRLVSKTAYVSLTANRRIALYRSGTCAVMKPSSYGSTGAWFYNGCDVRSTGARYIEAWYAATLPSAAVYSTLTLQVFGHTHARGGYNPLARTYGWIDRVGGATWVVKTVDFRYSTARWVSYASTPATGFVSSTHRVAFGFGVNNHWYPAPNDVDLHYLRLVVVMKVLV